MQKLNIDILSSDHFSSWCDGKIGNCLLNSNNLVATNRWGGVVKNNLYVATKYGLLGVVEYKSILRYGI